ncbi:Uma2 family endonuclease [Kitasatospora acidiphila]|uniref:Uma2 family endonuclease n=1 Tax=Kitasatospora acidiphila TaxID=2567942 RepID=A0A540W7X3_9ACTN|nr:Uma2 family endonuclease [Kitasatospora acidiphila]TQF05108.1 Uma2 family endonuclease [Kitasatospora acidiphila]
MSIDAATFARLREIADQLPQVPGIGAIEIADGQIVMMMSPVKRHEYAIFRLARQLNAQLPDTHSGYIAYAGADLEDSGLGRLRRPDLMVFPEATLRGEGPALLPQEVLLVVEIVSKSNPENDYENKVRDYAAMGIPHYLLVDPRDGTGIVHSEPKYASREKFTFGDQVTVGPWTIDTSELMTYGPGTT